MYGYEKYGKEMGKMWVVVELFFFYNFSIYEI